MEFVFNGKRIKYEDEKIWLLRETKNPYWFELKGCVDSYGYRRVGINNRKFLYHRIVYLLYNPDWDILDNSHDKSIDHIDRDKLNNSIDNLRVVNHQQNHWNRGNVKGYSFDKRTKKWKKNT